MAKNTYDLIVIGSGPAGESAAMNAVKAGKKVAIVCDKPRPGGNCTYLGTIPSKALRHGVKQVMQFNTNPMFRECGDVRKVTFPQLLKHANRVVEEQGSLRSDFGRASQRSASTLASPASRSDASAHCSCSSSRRVAGSACCWRSAPSKP